MYVDRMISYYLIQLSFKYGKVWFNVVKVNRSRGNGGEKGNIGNIPYACGLKNTQNEGGKYIMHRLADGMMILEFSNATLMEGIFCT